MLKRILTVTLAMLMLAGMLSLFSCKKDEEPIDTGDTVSTIAPSNSDDPTERFDVPAELDYGKKVFTVMGYNWVIEEFGNSELKEKSIIDEALINRDNYLRDYLGIELKILQENGQYYDVQTYTANIENSINAQTGAYDIICAYSLAPPLMAGKSLMTNMNAENFGEGNENYLDFSKIWWPEYMVGTSMINDRIYFVSGDVSSCLLFNLQAVMFDATQLRNKQIDEEELYSMVDDGAWTIEYMLDITAGLSDNIGDEVWDDNDFYAISSNAATVYDSFYISTGNKILENKDGALVISEDITSERVLDIYSMVYSAVYTDHIMRNPSTNANLLKSGNCIFQLGTLNELRSMTIETDSEIGLLPFPKYDEGDDAYLSLIGSPHSQFCIPIDAPDASMSSAVIETMAYANYEMVTPVIFETAMKVRYSKDTNTSRMYDIARAGATTDLGILHYFTFNANNCPDPQSMFRNSIMLGETSWISRYRNNYEAGMKRTVNALNQFYLG